MTSQIPTLDIRRFTHPASPVDRQAFIDATASVYDEYRERFPELVDTIVAEAKK